MSDQSEAITNYILAKDGNRPWLMQQTFAEDALLEMDVRTNSISFPPFVSGIAAITEVLVRQFSLENENVYTFCLSAEPKRSEQEFSCDWLVGMSRRDTSDIRVGFGCYDWVFEGKPRLLVSALKITIDEMLVLDRNSVQPIKRWLTGLPYPWCPPDTALTGIPAIDKLKPISDFLSNRRCKHP